MCARALVCVCTNICVVSQCDEEALRKKFHERLNYNASHGAYFSQCKYVVFAVCCRIYVVPGWNETPERLRVKTVVQHRSWLYSLLNVHTLTCKQLLGQQLFTQPSLVLCKRYLE